MERAVRRRAPEPEPATAKGDLPEAFWGHIDRGEKISAIKALRSATGFPLMTAKNVVDRIIPREPGTPRVPERHKGAALHTLPLGTVIRVRGTFSVGQPGYDGYVFEKTSRTDWSAIADEDDYSEDEIQERSSRGWDVLYTPEAT